VLLAVLIAGTALSLVGYGLGHSRARRFKDDGGSTATRDPRNTPQADDPKREKPDDDPSQVDTIVLGDAADAPVPARRDRQVSDVHATVIIHLPRYGEQTGLIPDSPSGHLLYRWLAAFNQGSLLALQDALPNEAPFPTAAAQMALRVQTGGFNLLSAREIQPGVLVFRLRDQTPAAMEVLGTLQMRSASNPPAIATFSLREVMAADTKAAGSKANTAR
jgi:hypothetical protein